MIKYNPYLEFSIHDVSFQHKMCRTAEKVFFILFNAGMLQEKDRQAFVFTIWSRNMPVPLFQSVIGRTFPDEDFAKNCWHFSKEKLERQFKNNHTSSVATRDFDQKKFAGSISVKIKGVEWGFSTSGLKEWEDQAVSIIVPCLVIPNINLEQQRFQRILKISGNFDDQKNALEFTAKAYKIVRDKLSFERAMGL